jgi:DNA recombination protein RmuC
MDQNTIYIIIGALIFVIIFLIAKLSAKSGDSNTSFLFKQQEERLERTRQELNQLLQKQNEIINNQLSKSNSSAQQQFDISQRALSQSNKTTNEIINKVTEKLTILEKTNEQVVDFAKQLNSLEKILKNPKQRGILGEYFLETTLKNVLAPESFQMQYKFKNSEIVDAVVFIKDKIVPIDSKFSLENYNKLIIEEDLIIKKELERQFITDLKKRVEETSKYIRPEEGTMDFAFMFIPSEGIYYDLLVNKIGSGDVNSQDIITYAFSQKNVIIVSPTSFLAYLQTVLQGLRALKIEESALQIRENVTLLAKHLKAYDEYFDKIGKHLGTTVNSYNFAQKELKKIDKDVLRITGDSMELVSEVVDGE